MIQTWDRETIEGLRFWERPTVRCRLDCVYVDQDGNRTTGKRDTTGRIVIDGNNPWIEASAASIRHAEQFSWGLVLDVLNDKYAAPIMFNREFEYEI